VTPQVAFRVQRAVQVAGSQEPSVSVPAQQGSAVRWVRGRARPEVPAVARPVPVWQEEVRPSEERKEESAFAAAQPVQNAPEESREGSEPQEASPSAGAAEVARTVAALQGPAFAAAVREVAQRREAERQPGDGQPEERREIWAPASAPASVPASAPVVSAPAWALVSLAARQGGSALWLAQGRVWRCSVHSRRIWSNETPRQRSIRERGRAIAELGACRWPFEHFADGIAEDDRPDG
jgi:hypothetical protein